MWQTTNSSNVRGVGQRQLVFHSFSCKEWPRELVLLNPNFSAIFPLKRNNRCLKNIVPRDTSVNPYFRIRLTFNLRALEEFNQFGPPSITKLIQH